MPFQVEVRPYVASDADDLYAAARESVNEVGVWMPWCHPGYKLSDAEWWIESTVTGRNEKSMYDFAIVADGAYAGGCGLNHINWSDRLANLGFWVRSSLARRGIATAAAFKVVQWGFDETNLNRIEIVAACENLPSQRVAEKLGATKDAVLRKRTMVRESPADAFLYSVIRPD